MLHGDDVVANLPRPKWMMRGRRLTGLETKKLTHVGLRTLDARAEHGFQSQVRPDEQVRVGDQPSNPAKTMDGARRFVKQCDDFLGQVEAARQRFRVERPEPRRIPPYDSPGV
jgi:hypothetical protein